MLYGYSARSTKNRSYSARITLTKWVIVQEVLKEED